MPADTQFLGLSGINSVPVYVRDAVTAALPEFCLVLPTGEVIDMEQYDDNIPLPAEVQHDENASASALLMVQFEEPPPKRSRYP